MFNLKSMKALLLLVLLGAVTAADAQVQPQLAQRYFEEATKLCERDAGRLWGVSLCGLMVIVDQATRTMPAAGSRTSDSTGAVGIPGAGIVFFRNFTLSAQWGRLNAEDGVLIASDESTVSVPVSGALEGTTLQGDGWRATLNSGWVVRPAARSGSFTIVREK